jgi:ornithine cyclodeaminase
MALIGNGAQSEFQALAFQHLVGITTLRLYDIDPQATAKLVSNLSGSGLKLVVCPSVAHAVKGADIVTTITADKTCATILSADMLEPGMHINAVGGDCPGKTELSAGVLRAAKVFVEYELQTRMEGDIQQMPPDFAVTELWEVLSQGRAGRDSAAQITVFDSVGFALEDFSALRFMHDAALALGYGQRLDLIPSMRDPKNLFGTLLSTTAKPSTALPTPCLL